MVVQKAGPLLPNIGVKRRTSIIAIAHMMVNGKMLSKQYPLIKLPVIMVDTESCFFVLAAISVW